VRCRARGLLAGVAIAFVIVAEIDEVESALDGARGGGEAHPIGGAIAAKAGADFLCYVTPSEHLGLPGVEDVRQGVMASRIAAHAGDIAKRKDAIEADRKLSRARKSLDWEAQIRLSIDPRRARSLREANPSADSQVCSMCGSLCAIKITGE